MLVEFKVQGKPPKKDGASSMWGKASEAENMRVVAWVALMSGNEGLQRWHRMQCIKMSSTLRISHKHEKASPRIVRREGTQKDRIPDFLEKRDKIKNIIRY